MSTTDKNQPIINKLKDQLSRDPSSVVFAQLAESYRKIGDAERAIVVLKQGIKNHPSYKLAYLILSNCYFELKDFSLAYATLRPFVEAERNNIKLQKLFAQICQELGHQEEALEAYKFVLFINPRDKEVAKVVSELERKQDKIEEYSENLIDESQDYSPAEHEFNTQPLHESRGGEVDIDQWIQVDLSLLNTPELKNKDDEKIENWEVESAANSSKKMQEIHNEVTSNPVKENNRNSQEAPVLTLTLVDLYMAQGYYEKAIEILRKIIELRPNDTLAQEKLAYALDKSGSAAHRLKIVPEDKIFEDEEGISREANDAFVAEQTHNTNKSDKKQGIDKFINLSSEFLKKVKSTASKKRNIFESDF